MKTMYVINETAGAGRAAAVWQRLMQAHPHIKHNGFKTSAPGHATDIAATAHERGYDAVIAVGGDGTLNEVLNGIVVSGFGVALGQIPCGTGNDFARSVTLPRRTADAYAVPHTVEPLPTDIGFINGKAFINVAGFGFDAAVADDIIRRSHKRKTRGPLPYLLSVFRVLRHYRATPMEIEIDGITINQPVFLGAVGNGSTYGGGMQICPSARVDDGLLSVCLAGDVAPLEAVMTIARVFKGQHTDHPKCTFLSARKVVVRGDESVLVHADGQMIGRLPVTVEIKPAAVRFFRPHGGDSGATHRYAAADNRL